MSTGDQTPSTSSSPLSLGGNKQADRDSSSPERKKERKHTLSDTLSGQVEKKPMQDVNEERVTDKRLQEQSNEVNVQGASASVGSHVETENLETAKLLTMSTADQTPSTSGSPLSLGGNKQTDRDSSSNERKKERKRTLSDTLSGQQEKKPMPDVSEERVIDEQLQEQSNEVSVQGASASAGSHAEKENTETNSAPRQQVDEPRSSSVAKMAATLNSAVDAIKSRSEDIRKASEQKDYDSVIQQLPKHFDTVTQFKDRVRRIMKDPRRSERDYMKSLQDMVEYLIYLGQEYRIQEYRNITARDVKDFCNYDKSHKILFDMFNWIKEHIELLANLQERVESICRLHKQLRK